MLKHVKVPPSILRKAQSNEPQLVGLAWARAMALPVVAYDSTCQNTARVRSLAVSYMISIAAGHQVAYKCINPGLWGGQD